MKNSKLWISFFLYSFIPIIPLLLKWIIVRDIDGGTVSISAAMYIIGAAISNERFLLVIIYFFMAIVILPFYGILESTAKSNLQENLLIVLCFIMIVITMVISFFDYYRLYVQECRPLEIKFAEDLARLTGQLNE